MKNKEEPKHALLAPSSANRWMACPGSVYLSTQCPPTASSVYAEEGTHAHAVAEKILSEWLFQDIDIVEAYEAHKDLFQDNEMAEHVLEYCLACARLMMERRPERVAVEKKFTIIPELSWGTADFAFVHKKLVTTRGNGKRPERWGVIVDLKYGQGYPVDVRGNLQLTAYAVGMDNEPEWGPLDGVEVFIYQPRADHVDGPLRALRLDRRELDRMTKQIEVAASEAIRQMKNEEPKFSAGDHCRWCPGIAICAVHAAKMHNTAEIDFTEIPTLEEKGDALVVIEKPTVKRTRTGGTAVEARGPMLLTDEKLQKIVLARAEIEQFLKRVEEFCINRAKAGSPIEGLKLVHGRSSRKWIDETEVVAESLVSMGIDDPFQKPKLLGITEAEKALSKIMGKKDAKEALDSYTTKAMPSLKIVSIDDPRPEASALDGNAAIDFSDISED